MCAGVEGGKQEGEAGDKAETIAQLDGTWMVARSAVGAGCGVGGAEDVGGPRGGSCSPDLLSMAFPNPGSSGSRGGMWEGET